MKFRAVIKKSHDWWIGWLVDLPGVNAQEKSREDVVVAFISEEQLKGLAVCGII